MAVRESVVYLLLILSRKVVVTIDHLCITARRLNQIVDLLGRDTAPTCVSTLGYVEGQEKTHQCLYCHD
jgi:hypothetical protein